VYTPPTLAKSFVPPTIASGARARWRLTLTTRANAAAVTGISVTDPLGTFKPERRGSGHGDFTPGHAARCTFARRGGRGRLRRDDGGPPRDPVHVASLAAGASCQVDVNVTSSTPGPPTTPPAAPRRRTVAASPERGERDAHRDRPATISKTSRPRPIGVGGASTLTFTLTTRTARRR